jgi:pilus assembly protein CpaC
MPVKPLIRAVAFAVLVAAGGSAFRAVAAEQRSDAGTSSIPVAAGEAGMRFLSLGVGKSVVVDLPRDVKDVLVADPKIANAVIRTARRAYLIGVKVGQTNIVFFDEEGRQIGGYDIAVTRDLNSIRAALKRVLPDADIKVEGLGEQSVVLSGTVATPAESQLAFDLAVRLVAASPSSVSNSGGGTVVNFTSTNTTGGGAAGSGNETPVVNALTIRGRDQVMLKVTVAEVQRDIIKQLGIDLNGTLSTATTVLDFNNANPFSAFGTPLSDQNRVAATFKSVSSTLRAMERAGVVRTLAEPNLSAISGESASFLAGGEFPIPAGYSCDPQTRNCQLAVQFKKFGVGLNFTPVVLSEGRISLKVMTEVSELSNENSITLVQQISTTQTQTTTIPSIRTRRADTTVEIPSGGTLAMAGMIQEQTKQQINGFPGLMRVPVLGTLFRSRDFVNRQTELMVLVTPYVVQAVGQKKLSRPDDGFADASDPATMLLGRLNRLYGVVGGADPRHTYHGKYGFILD